jgi:hypothetical protein
MRLRSALLAMLLIGVVGLAAAAPASAASTRRPSDRSAAGAAAKSRLAKHRHARVCATPRPGRASCNAIVDRDVSGNVSPAVAPQGYGPSDLQAAYRLPSGSAGGGRTVAVVDAFDLASAESDLATYRSRFGLPACTTANGCFRKVNQAGGSTVPSADSGWGQEIDLDLQMVSASCPNCNILLVEANDDGSDNVGAAVNTAVALGASVVSNSYGGDESSDEAQDDAHYYQHAGVAIVASSGDDGYGVEYPAASPYVTAVGGTSLTADSSARGFSETAWVGAGSGCSAYEAKPSWQTDTGCSRRTVADVSADADPDTGVAVYDSTPSRGQSGWMVFGGTSAAAPLIAGTYALAGQPSARSYPVSAAYANPSGLFDVTSGSNGTCGVSYFCTARTGYDGPTGLGSPNGIAAFSTTAASATADPPGAPSGVAASADDARATVSWTAPTSNGGAAITGYVVTPSVNGTAQASRPYASTATTQSLTGLTNGSSYTFTVAATNAAGTGPASAPSSPVTPRAATVTIGGAASRVTTYGGAVPVSGTATPGCSVALWYHGAGSTGYVRGQSVTASGSGAWNTGYVANNDYRVYATCGSAQSPGILVQIAPTISGGSSHVVRTGSTYTISGTGIPGATLTVHFHKAGTATNDYSLLRTVSVASNGSWSRPYVASMDYRFYASLPNGQVSPVVLVQAR